MKFRMFLRELTLLLMTMAVIIGVSSPAMAQSEVTVSGTVYDNSLQDNFPGVMVMVVGTTNGTYTDGEGAFTIKAPVGSVLQFTFLGYKTQEYRVERAISGLRIAMDEDTHALDELIILGYGVNTRKQDLSASVGVIDNTEELAVRPVSSTEGMLQGQLAGVTVQSVGGDPTGVPNIVIRGQGSQNGDNVLWVVDGIPGAPITSMSDIESIVVLKDAASAAIYGAQSGAGGVVLVTTKQAKEGVPTLSYDGIYGFRQAANLPTPLTAEEQLKMRQMSYKNAGQTLPGAWDPAKNPWIATTRTQWMKEIFRPAFYNRHNVALNVGTDRSANRISFAYEDNKGILLNTYSRNFSIRYNGKYDINRYLTISEDLVWKNTTGRSKSTNDGYTGPVLSAIYMPSSATVYNPLDGTFGGTTTEDPAYIAKYGSNFAEAHGDAVNPVRLLTADNYFNKNSDLWTTTTFTLSNFVEGLKYTGRFTYNLYSYYGKNFSPIRDEPGKPDISNSLYEGSARGEAWKTENTITYDNTFGDHTVSALLSTTADHWEEIGHSGEAKGFSDESENLQFFPFADTTLARDYFGGPDANVSIVSRLGYSYADRYFATVSWRRDYAGRLPKNNNYGDFPAVTAAWKLSNESFFPESDIVNLVKLRGSWGRIGNLGSIPANYKSGTLSSTFWDEQAVYGVEEGALYNNIVYYNNAVNPFLTWETSEQWDLGIDLALFKERLSLSVDYFDKRTFNLIQEQTMDWPETIGLNPMLINQGEVSNKGIEITAAWSDKITKDFSYSISGNVSYLKNKVTNIGVKNADGSPGVWTNSGSKFRSIPYMMQTAEGEPLGSFYLIQTDGIFQSDEEAAAYQKDGQRIQPNAVAGDLKFVDINNDGVINDDDRQYMGNAMPDWTYAGTFSMKYRDFGFSLMLQGVQGAQALHVAKYMTLNDTEGSFNRDSRILDAWSPENRGSDIPRLTKADTNNNFTTPSDFYLEDASYLRIKNVTLSYDLTEMIRNWSHLGERKSTAQIYLSGENLFTFTKYTGMDPETGGWDAMTYPVSRVFSLGVKLTY
ncbi:MAG: TonB-dependent receptor [Porphyromonas sp.]|nr:TonB-dependent receptor [Porphyromonas sp.]